MTTDVRLSEIEIPADAQRKLEALEIRGVRQLYARLQRERIPLQRHLELSDGEFVDLLRKVEAYIHAEHPEDRQPQAHPIVNKTGVAIDRLHDPARPRYGLRGGRHR